MTRNGPATTRLGSGLAALLAAGALGAFAGCGATDTADDVQQGVDEAQQGVEDAQQGVEEAQQQVDEAGEQAEKAAEQAQKAAEEIQENATGGGSGE
jgi:hypothetical protein